MRRSDEVFFAATPRSHAACGLWIASCVIALLGGCETQSLDPNKPGQVRAEAGAMNGMSGTHRGVISFDIDGGHDCTGVMIGPYHALTAAHCTNQAGSGQAQGTMRRTVNYYDPARGKRPISATMTRLRVSVLPGWLGLSNPPGWAGADLQSDLALVEHIDLDGTTPLRWFETSPSDYIPIWLGPLGPVQDNTFYGGGYNDGRVGDLSSMPIAIAGSDAESFWDIGTTYRLCKGDSGGPYLATVSRDREVLVGVAVAGDGVNKTSPCSRNGGHQYGVRIDDTRVDWLNAATDGMCTVNGSSVECF